VLSKLICHIDEQLSLIDGIPIAIKDNILV